MKRLFNPSLPANGEHMKRVPRNRLLLFGTIMHFSTLNSVLRISKGFRAFHGKRWPVEAVKRFSSEFGLNVLLYITLVVLAYLYVPQSFMELAIVSLFIPSMLSCLQMSVDGFRPDADVYYDPRNISGLTVRSISTTDGYDWKFFNHYAFPVGYGHGKEVRNALHQEGSVREHDIICIPQNNIIEALYSNERPENLSKDNKYLRWSYSSSKDS